MMYEYVHTFLSHTYRFTRNSGCNLESTYYYYYPLQPFPLKYSTSKCYKVCISKEVPYVYDLLRLYMRTHFK